MTKINENKKTKKQKNNEARKQTNSLAARYAGDPREPWEIKRDMIREARKHSTISPAIG